MKRIALSIIIIGLLVISTQAQVQAFNVPVNLNVGDVFHINLTKMEATHKINGTSYIDSDIADLTQIPTGEAEIKVTSIYDKNKDTYVNATGNIGDLKIDGSTMVDGWESFMFTLFILALFSAFFDPDNYDFSAPTTQTTVTSVDKIDPPPIFATSNESYYQEIVSSLSNTSTSTTTSTSTSSQLITIQNSDFNATYDSTTKIFKLNMYFTLAGSGTNTKGDNWSFNGTFKLNIEIDVSKSFVYKLGYLFSTVVQIGAASEETSISLEWGKVNEENQSSGGVLGNLPGFTFYMAFVTLLAIPVFLRKYR